MSDRQVSLSDIARRLEVTLSAVSNWRRRHPSFPIAVQENGREVFQTEEVAEWLDGRKISKKDLKPGELPGMTYGNRFRGARIGRAADAGFDDDLWKELIRFRGAEDVAVFADLVLSLLYVAVSNDHDWADIFAAEGSRRFHLLEVVALKHRPVLRDLHHSRGAFIDMHGEARLDEIIRLVERMRRSGRGPELFEFMLNRFAAAEGRRAADVHTPAALVRLLVELVAPTPETSVFDPCCGSGGFLVGAAKYLESHGALGFGVPFTGRALSERSASLAHMNLRLHDIPADIEVRSDTIFPGDGNLIASERFDVIVSNPPFDLKESAWAAPTQNLYGRYGALPKSKTNFAWLQYVASALANGGRAAIVMPGGTLFREGAEKQVRANMVDDGIVEAVIALPSQLFVSTGIPVTVWLLNNQVRRKGEILIVDASELGHSISRTQRSLSSEDRRQVVDLVTKWRNQDGYEDVRGFSASVEFRRIREEGYVLTPARYVGSAGSGATGRSVQELRDDLVRLERRAALVDAAVEQNFGRIRAWIR